MKGIKWWIVRLYCINIKHTFLLNHKPNARLMLLYNHWVGSDHIYTREHCSFVESAPPISWSSARLGPDKTICWVTVDSRNPEYEVWSSAVICLLILNCTRGFLIEIICLRLSAKDLGSSIFFSITMITI